MIKPRLNSDGTVTVPARAIADTDERPGTIGDGVMVLSPGDFGYDEALAEATSNDPPPV